MLLFWRFFLPLGSGALFSIHFFRKTLHTNTKPITLLVVGPLEYLFPNFKYHVALGKHITLRNMILIHGYYSISIYFWWNKTKSENLVHSLWNRQVCQVLHTSLEILNMLLFMYSTKYYWGEGKVYWCKSKSDFGKWL